MLSSPALNKLKLTLPYARCSTKWACWEKSLPFPCSKTNTPSGLSNWCWKIKSGIFSNSGKAYGGSAKIKSNCWRQLLMKRNTSPRISKLLSVPNFVVHWRMKWACSRSVSTLTTLAHPLERSSSEMLPVPAKRSNAVASSKSTYALSTLKMFSLAKSVVGRALNERGMSKCLPLYSPVMMRMMSGL